VITPVKPVRPRQFGQATVEYTIVLILVVLVLIAEQDGEPGPIGLVVQTLKDLFQAYSWAISFSNNLTPF
jgi:Flp pilus assembly pilin Flp